MNIKKGDKVRHRDFQHLEIGTVIAVYGKQPNALYEVAFASERLRGSVTLPPSKIAPLHPLEALALEADDL